MLQVLALAFTLNRAEACKAWCLERHKDSLGATYIADDVEHGNVKCACLRPEVVHVKSEAEPFTPIGDPGPPLDAKEFMPAPTPPETPPDWP